MAVSINNKEYAWGDIVVELWGRTITGLRGVEYTSKKEKELLFGAGRNALGIQHGKRENEGTLTITQSELEAMNEAAAGAGYKDILDVELDIIVSYIPENTSTIVIDKIVSASFSEMPKGMSEGDMNSEHALPFIALDIEYGVQK